MERPAEASRRVLKIPLAKLRPSWSSHKVTEYKDLPRMKVQMNELSMPSVLHHDKIEFLYD